jgi:uncharacterized protein
MKRLRLAVVGSGVAGLSCAWLLSQAHDVTVFERDARIGGHANTVDVTEGDRQVAIDTGFIVYNTACYPNLIALFEHLGVPTAATRMGFAVSMGGGRYEYSGTGAHGLFGQPANLLNMDHWRMVRDVLRFFRDAEALVTDGRDENLTLGAWLDRRGYSDAFRRLHILPMAAAIWSAPDEEVMGYPVLAFARFFANHGLLQVRNRPQWRTVVGGSRSYVTRLRADTKAQYASGVAVRRIERTPSSVRIILADGRSDVFDHVVIASHADEAHAVLAQPSPDETRLLSAFRYQPNHTVLHTDTTLLPKRRRLWSSWNYIGNGQTDRLCVSYHMNSLQPLDTKTDYVVTLNPPRPIADHHVMAAFNYHHPLFDRAAIGAQHELWRLQGQHRTWYAGSYFGSGFHEDGLQSGLWVAEMLGGVKRPWHVAGENDRLHVGPTTAGRAMVEAAE